MRLGNALLGDSVEEAVTWQGFPMAGLARPAEHYPTLVLLAAVMLPW